MGVFFQLMSEVGTYVAICAIIFEVYIASKLAEHFRLAKGLIPSAREFQSSLEVSLNSVDAENFKNLLATELIDLSGTQHSTQNVRSILNRHLSSANEELRHLANLGPAGGLFFTFCGMLLTVLRISTSSIGTDAGILNQNLANLLPVFVGGALGILVYSFGTVLLDRIEKLELSAEDELMTTFLIFESSHEGTKPKTVEDAYNRLLGPLKKLLTRLESMNNEFQKLSAQTDGLITRFTEETTRFVGKIDEKASHLTSKLNSNLEALDNSSKNIGSLNTLFIESSREWKESATALSRFSESLLGFEDRLKKIADFSETVHTLTDDLGNTTNKIDKLVDWVEKDRLEFKRLEDDISKFVGSVPRFIDTAEQLKLDSKAMGDNLSPQLSDISKKIGELVERSPKALVDFQKDVMKYLRQIDGSLDRISKDGQVRKTIVSEALPVVHRSAVDQPRKTTSEETRPGASHMKEEQNPEIIYIETQPGAGRIVWLTFLEAVVKLRRVFSRVQSR